MAKEKAPRIADVTSDDKVSAASNGRPVIVTNRPIMRDPMMVQDTSPMITATAPPANSNATPPVPKKQIVPPTLAATSPTKIDIVGVTAHDSIPEADKATDAKTNSETDDNSGDNPNTDHIDDASIKAADEAAKLNKLVEAGTYVLPINAVERRRSQRTAILGLLLIILLAVAWLDLATDVGLIKLPHLPVTHFFSR